MSAVGYYLFAYKSSPISSWSASLDLVYPVNLVDPALYFVVDRFSLSLFLLRMYCKVDIIKTGFMKKGFMKTEKPVQFPSWMDFKCSGEWGTFYLCIVLFFILNGLFLSLRLLVLCFTIGSRYPGSLTFSINGSSLNLSVRFLGYNVVQ